MRRPLHAVPRGWFRVSDQLSEHDRRLGSSTLPKTSVVYFIAAGDHGPIKIGFASNLRRRLHGLQTGNHEYLKVLGWISPGTKEIEKQLHHDLRRHRIHGDWFQPTDEVWNLVASHARQDDF